MLYALSSLLYAEFQRTKDKDLQKAIQEVMSNVKT